MIEDFIDKQLAAWPLARANYDALTNIETKELTFGGMTFRVQFNPARIISTAAKIDKNSLEKRPCFLCSANRPKEQEGVPFGGRYTILVNPYPIFPRHLTIAEETHIPQKIDGRVEDMVRLAESLPGYTVFYNGPKCGASAPDHFHFQAGNSDFLPIHHDLENAHKKCIINEERAQLFAVDSLPLKLFIIDAIDSEAAATLFQKLYRALPTVPGHDEPMMNLLCQRISDKKTRLIIIPRKAHRPSFYGTEGDGQMLISPASVDLGGVFITPRREDFVRFDKRTIQRLFDELCLTSTELNEIVCNVE